VISTIQLKAGPVHGAPGLTIHATPITIFVGPNNSGKSRILTEIEQFCTNGVIQQFLGITVRPFLPEQIDKAIESVTSKVQPGDNIPVGNIIVGSRRGQSQVAAKQIRAWLEKPDAQTPIEHFTKR
jgi:ABC-type cobalamin/Fe3+-siderophores transport system ATPase subunit